MIKRVDAGIDLYPSFIVTQKRACQFCVREKQFFGTAISCMVMEEENETWYGI